jgi:hypothetical protein
VIDRHPQDFFLLHYEFLENILQRASQPGIHRRLKAAFRLNLRMNMTRQGVAQGQFPECSIQIQARPPINAGSHIDHFSIQ